MKKFLSCFLCILLLISTITGSAFALDMNLDMGEDVDYNVEYPIIELEGKYKTQGRATVIDGVLMTDYTASGIEFYADCKGDVVVTFNATYFAYGGDEGGCFFTVIVDGVKKSRNFCQLTELGKTYFVISEGLDEGVHHFEIYRQTEIEYATVGIEAITLEGELLDAPEDKDLYVEFVGSSSFCGFGNLGPASITDQAEAAKPIYQDGTQSVTYLTARALDADYSIVARQGTGVKYSWQSQNMLFVYPLLRAQKDQTTPYNFERKADIVVLGLGGNDVTKASSLNNDSDATNNVTNDDIVASYKEMFALIRAKNPDAVIVWACNMTTTDTYTLAARAMAESGGAEAGYYAVKLTSNIEGAKTHPSAAAQKIQAEELTKFIKENIYWDKRDVDFSYFEGNSIRVTGNQGLRFKYSVDANLPVNGIAGYTVKEIGALAIRSDYLGYATLQLNGSYTYNNKVRTPIKGVFYSSNGSVDMVTDDGICSAVLFNIGYNKTNNTTNFAAYENEYTVRMYMVLSKYGKDITVYDTADKASVFAVMKYIEEKFADETPAEGTQLYADYQTVQTFLTSDVTDVNGKKVSDFYNK